MNTEEIKMIIDLLSNTTEGAKDLMLLLIIKDIAIFFLGYVLGLIGIILSAKILNRLVRSYTFGEQIANLCNIDLDYRSEKKAFITKLQKFLNE